MKEFTTFFYRYSADTSFKSSYREYCSFKHITSLSLRQSDVLQQLDDKAFLPPIAGTFYHESQNPNVACVGNELGEVYLLDSRKRATKSVVKTKHFHNNAIKCVRASHLTGDLLSASSDSSVKVVSPDLEDVVMNIPRSHSTTANTCSWSYDSQNTFASGGRDGTISLWDTRVPVKKTSQTCVPVLCIKDAYITTDRKTCDTDIEVRRVRRLSEKIIYAVTFIPFNENKIASICSADPSILVWDLRSGVSGSNSSSRLTRKRQEPVASTISYADSRFDNFGYLSLAVDGFNLYASSTNHKVFKFYTTDLCRGLYNLPQNSLVPEMSVQVKRHTMTSHRCIDVSHSGEYLVSGVGHDAIYVWNTNFMTTPCAKFSDEFAGNEHGNRFLTCFNKTPELKILSSSDKSPVLIWRSDTCRQDISRAESAKCEVLVPMNKLQRRS